MKILTKKGKMYVLFCEFYHIDQIFERNCYTEEFFATLRRNFQQRNIWEPIKVNIKSQSSFIIVAIQNISDQPHLEPLYTAHQRLTHFFQILFAKLSASDSAADHTQR
jgi:hypothetical protein